MTAAGGASITIDQEAIKAVGAALKSETDGKQLRRDLLKEIRVEARPVVAGLKSAALSMPSSGLNQGVPLRSAIAAGIVPQTRLGGRDPGVAIRAKTTPGVRKFKLAARRTNAASWRHRVYGGSAWVEQTGDPGWFDRTTPQHHEHLRDGVMRAVHDMARRVASRSNTP